MPPVSFHGILSFIQDNVVQVVQELKGVCERTLPTDVFNLQKRINQKRKHRNVHRFNLYEFLRFYKIIVGEFEGLESCISFNRKQSGLLPSVHVS